MILAYLPAEEVAGVWAWSEMRVAGPPMASSRPARLQLLGHRHRVGRLAGAVERADGVVDVAVGRTVEVVDRHRLDRGGDGVAAQQHGAQQRLLGLEVVGRDPHRVARAGVVDAGDAHRRLLSTTAGAANRRETRGTGHDRCSVHPRACGVPRRTTWGQRRSDWGQPARIWGRVGTRCARPTPQGHFSARAWVECGGRTPTAGGYVDEVFLRSGRRRAPHHHPRTV